MLAELRREQRLRDAYTDALTQSDRRSSQSISTQEEDLFTVPAPSRLLAALARNLPFPLNPRIAREVDLVSPAFVRLIRQPMAVRRYHSMVKVIVITFKECHGFPVRE